MNKRLLKHPPCYFDRYIAQVKEDELAQAFQTSFTALEALDLGLLKALGDQTYAPNKWTISAVFRHLIDAELILSYRALRFGRQDPTPLSGFDQDVLTAHSSPLDTPLEDLIAALKATRRATEWLFKSFDPAGLSFLGTASGMQMSALGFGFIILGHQHHHLQILQERYVPLYSPLP